MEHSSTRTISSAIGGSTSTALRPRDCTLLMTKLPLNARLTLELLLLEDMMLPLMLSRMPKLPTVKPPVTPGTDVDPRTSALPMSEEAGGTEEEVKP